MSEGNMRLMRRSLPAAVLLLLPSVAIALGPQPPDQVDVFYQTNVRPQIELLLDTSCSMNGASGVAYCPWYTGQYGISQSDMNSKEHQMRAALVGCARANDGVLDRWAP